MSDPATTTVYSSKSGVCAGSLQPAGLRIQAMLTADAPVFARPTCSVIVFGGSPAAATVTGVLISMGMSSLGQSISVVNPVDDTNFFMYTGADPVTALMADLLDVNVIPGADKEAEFGDVVSYERLADVQGEALLFLNRPDTSNDVLTKQPLYDLIPAVKAGQVYEVTEGYGVYGGSSGLQAMKKCLEGIAAFLGGLK